MNAVPAAASAVIQKSIRMAGDRRVRFGTTANTIMLQATPPNVNRRSRAAENVQMMIATNIGSITPRTGDGFVAELADESTMVQLEVSVRRSARIDGVK